MKNGKVDQNLKLVDIHPKTAKQRAVLKSPKEHQIMSGAAGTGKTFLASYKAYKKLLDKECDSIIYIRSAVPTRNMGFLPGDDKDKSKVYELPYRDIAKELFGRGDAYDCFKNKKKVDFLTTSYIRGTTLRNAVVIVDEIQNMTYHELDSVITRVGENCTIYFCGDFNQSDLKDSGIRDFFKVLNQMGEFEHTIFGIEDIVRSGLVKTYLETKHRVLNGKESDNKQPDIFDC